MCFTGHILSLILCSIIVVNMILKDYRISVPHIMYTIICKVPQSSRTFQAQIQPQRPGRFFNTSQRRAQIGRCVQIKKADAEYTFEHGEVIYQALDVLIHPVTTKITQFPERQETAQGFHHEANGEFKKLRMYQQHCSFHNTKLIDRVKRRKPVRNKNIPPQKCTLQEIYFQSGIQSAMFGANLTQYITEYNTTYFQEWWRLHRVMGMLVIGKD